MDDDEYICLSLKLLLDQHYEMVTELNDPNAIPASLETAYDVVILDMNYSQGETSGKEGIEWLQKIREIQEDISVVMLTAYGEVDTAVNAMKAGATDFIVKPWSNEKMLATVNSALRLTREKNRSARLASQQKIISSDIDEQVGKMTGHSPAMEQVMKLIKKVAPTMATVLITGENGTGKEVTARTIHRLSDRRNVAFIPVDLGAIHPNLFESELFGHKKGAFTDAREERIGRFEAASGGTLFLDEIGNLPLNLQSKLLTVLERREITRVGSNQSIPVDARILCATNSDLPGRVKEGSFREDLLYRINTVEITIPPLRERPADIPVLAGEMLDRFARKYQREGLRLTEPVIRLLRKYAWPGNVRELQHAMERAVIMSEGDNLKEDDFAFIQSKQEDFRHLNNYNLEHLEAWAIRNAVKKHAGNISHAANELGLSRGAMYRRMEKYNIG